MKLTNKELKKIIKEELQKELLGEMSYNPNVEALTRQSLNHLNKADQYMQAGYWPANAFNKEVLLAIKAVQEAVLNLNQIEPTQRATKAAQKKP